MTPTRVILPPGMHHQCSLMLPHKLISFSAAILWMMVHRLISFSAAISASSSMELSMRNSRMLLSSTMHHQYSLMLERRRTYQFTRACPTSSSLLTQLAMHHQYLWM
eukprot:12418082-Karenia_brevis.AAC.1